ncbi:MAG: hypothetical protein R3B55_00635 [Candidatus Paceibacterota bacterium]
MSNEQKYFWVVEFPVAIFPGDYDESRWVQTFAFVGTSKEALLHFGDPSFVFEVMGCQKGRPPVALMGGAEKITCFNCSGMREEVLEKELFSSVGVIFEWERN